MMKLFVPRDEEDIEEIIELYIQGDTPLIRDVLDKNELREAEICEQLVARALYPKEAL